MQIASPLSRVICINWRRDAGAAPKMTARPRKNTLFQFDCGARVPHNAAQNNSRRVDCQIRFVSCLTHLPAFAARSCFFGWRIIQIWFLRFGGLPRAAKKSVI